MSKPERVRSGDTLDVEIVDVDERGDGVGTLIGGSGAAEAHGSQADASVRVMVPGAFPGERARVRAEHVAWRKGVIYGHLLEVNRAVPARRDAMCAQHESGEGRCSGCPLMCLEDSDQRELVRARVNRAYGLAVDEVVHGEPLGYRMSAKRVVGGRARAVVFGSYVRGSHRIADMAGCLVDHPTIVDCLAELRREADAAGVEPYDEKTRVGELRYVWLKTDGDRVLLTLVLAREPSRALRNVAGSLKSAWGVAWSLQASTGNEIRGGPAQHLAGGEELKVSLGDEDMRVGALGFLQPNPAVAARGYADLISDSKGAQLSGELAYDLYAGTGLVTRALGHSFARVLACESYPESAKLLGVEPLGAREFLSQRHELGERPELIVANPPRRGLGADVCAGVLALGPARINIMSCKPRTLADDLASLSEDYEVEAVRAYATLPQTAHVELVAWLVRRRQ